MKSLLLFVTWLFAAATSVAAISPALALALAGTHRFSRKSMREWKEYVKADKEVVHRYRDIVQWIKKYSPDQEMNGCPDELRDAQIELVQATGRYVKQTSTGRFPGMVVDWTHLPTKDTGKLNNVEFTYIVLSADGKTRCGEITVKTDSQGRHWQKPSYSQITRRTALMSPIDLDRVIFSAGETYYDAKMRIPELAHGFWNLDLVKLLVYDNTWPDPRWEPVYRFRGTKGDKNAVILVATADTRRRTAVPDLPQAPTRAINNNINNGDAIDLEG